MLLRIAIVIAALVGALIAEETKTAEKTKDYSPAARAKIAEWEAYAASLKTQLNALAQKYGQCTVSSAILESGKPIAQPAPVPTKE